MLVCKQLEARRMMRQPADVFGGTAHQAVWLADETPMQAAAQGLDKTEDQKFRRSSFEKTHAAIVAEITDEESG
jgi:hypothetical protein